VPRPGVRESVRRIAPDAVKRLRRRLIVDEFHRLYYTSAQRTWLNTRWLGVRVSKCPLDLWVYQELIVEVQPDLVIETGTLHGGSALYLASCMDLVGRGRVVTVDVEERAGRPEHPRITYVAGSSVAPEVLERVRREAEGATTVMVVLDSDHSRDHVLAELHSYSPLVTPGSYLIVEDTNVDGGPVHWNQGPGPHEAIEAFLAERAPFARDAGREKFFLTFNPGGFLRRLDGPRQEP
jgi:cephalosporin hydroxylase